MKEHLQDFIHKRVASPDETEIQAILQAFNEVTYNKGDLFKKQDTRIEHLGFLVSGSARSYFIKDNGEEISFDIHQEICFLSDIISVRSNKESPVIIEFLEKSNVLAADMENVWMLLGKNITFNILIREYMGDRAMELLKMHHMFLNGTAKERYRYVLETNPSLLQKYPLRFIASIIGVTPTQLSRIRKDLDW